MATKLNTSEKVSSSNLDSLDPRRNDSGTVPPVALTISSSSESSSSTNESEAATLHPISVLSPPHSLRASYLRQQQQQRVYAARLRQEMLKSGKSITDADQNEYLQRFLMLRQHHHRQQQQQQQRFNRELSACMEKIDRQQRKQRLHESQGLAQKQRHQQNAGAPRVRHPGVRGSAGGNEFSPARRSGSTFSAVARGGTPKMMGTIRPTPQMFYSASTTATDDAASKKRRVSSSSLMTPRKKKRGRSQKYDDTTRANDKNISKDARSAPRAVEGAKSHETDALGKKTAEAQSILMNMANIATQKMMSNPSGRRSPPRGQLVDADDEDDNFDAGSFVYDPTESDDDDEEEGDEDEDEEEESWKCVYCDREYETERGLRIHIGLSHKNVKNKVTSFQPVKKKKVRQDAPNLRRDAPTLSKNEESFLPRGDVIWEPKVGEKVDARWRGESDPDYPGFYEARVVSRHRHPTTNRILYLSLAYKGHKSKVEHRVLMHDVRPYRSPEDDRRGRTCNTCNVEFSSMLALRQHRCRVVVDLREEDQRCRVVDDGTSALRPKANASVASSASLSSSTSAAHVATTAVVAPASTNKSRADVAPALTNKSPAELLKEIRKLYKRTTADGLATCFLCFDQKRMCDMASHIVSCLSQPKLRATKTKSGRCVNVPMRKGKLTCLTCYKQLDMKDERTYKWHKCKGMSDWDLLGSKAKAAKARDDRLTSLEEDQTVREESETTNEKITTPAARTSAETKKNDEKTTKTAARARTIKKARENVVRRGTLPELAKNQGWIRVEEPGSKPLHQCVLCGQVMSKTGLFMHRRFCTIAEDKCSKPVKRRRKFVPLPFNLSSGTEIFGKFAGHGWVKGIVRGCATRPKPNTSRPWPRLYTVFWEDGDVEQINERDVLMSRDLILWGADCDNSFNGGKSFQAKCPKCYRYFDRRGYPKHEPYCTGSSATHNEDGTLKVESENVVAVLPSRPASPVEKDADTSGFSWKMASPPSKSGNVPTKTAVQSSKPSPAETKQASHATGTKTKKKGATGTKTKKKGKRKYVCPICGKSFNSPRGVWVHKGHVHRSSSSSAVSSASKEKQMTNGKLSAAFVKRAAAKRSSLPSTSPSKVSLSGGIEPGDRVTTNATEFGEVWARRHFGDEWHTGRVHGTAIKLNPTRGTWTVLYDGDLDPSESKIESLRVELPMIPS